MLTNARREMSPSLADVTGITRERRSRGTGSLTLNILPMLKEEKANLISMLVQYAVRVCVALILALLRYLLMIFSTM